jgi:hypothetical protein
VVWVLRDPGSGPGPVGSHRASWRRLGSPPGSDYASRLGPSPSPSSFAAGFLSRATGRRPLRGALTALAITADVRAVKSATRSFVAVQHASPVGYGPGSS